MNNYSQQTKPMGRLKRLTQQVVKKDGALKDKTVDSQVLQKSDFMGGESGSGVKSPCLICQREELFKTGGVSSENSLDGTLHPLTLDALRDPVLLLMMRLPRLTGVAYYGDKHEEDITREYHRRL